MEEFYKCSKIQFINNDIDFSLPKTGECSLTLFENYGTITLKMLRSKIYINSEVKQEVITYQVYQKVSLLLN